MSHKSGIFRGGIVPNSATIVVVILLLIIMSTCNDKGGDPSPPPSGTDTTPQDPTAVVVQTQRPWTIQTFDIPEGGLPVYLYPGWKTFPLHGKITITTPSGQILHDEPGVLYNFGWQNEGGYTFQADPIGSKRGVGIYNRW